MPHQDIDRRFHQVSKENQPLMHELLSAERVLRRKGFTLSTMAGKIKLRWKGLDLYLLIDGDTIHPSADRLPHILPHSSAANYVEETWDDMAQVVHHMDAHSIKDVLEACDTAARTFKEVAELIEELPEMSSERTASMKTAIIRKLENGDYALYTRKKVRGKDGKWRRRRLGTHPSLEAAQRQERAIQRSKHGSMITTRLRKLARKFSTERYLQAPSEGKEYLRDHAKRIKVMVREMAERMTPETREKLQIGNPKPLGAGLNGFVFAGSEPGVVVKAAFNLNDAIMAERVMKMEKGLECLPRVYKVLRHVRLYDGAIGCHLIYLERLRPLPVKVAKALETMLDGVMHDDNYQVKRFSPAMYMRALQKVVERAPKGSVMSWTAMQLQVILKELANQKWWHIDLHSENFCLSADGKRLKMIDLGALMDPEEVAHMWGPIAFPQEHTARVRTAASDAARKKRLLQRVTPEQEDLLKALLRGEGEIEALGFKIEVRADLIVLSWEGTALGLEIAMHGTPLLNGMPADYPEELDELVAEVRPTPVSILKFLKASAGLFRTIADNAPSMPELSSEE